MKKNLLVLLLSFCVIFKIFSFERSITHSYEADYRLFPETAYTQKYINQLKGKYQVKYCVQSNLIIPKEEAKGYTCEQILKKLDQMGGLDKECYGVSYIDYRTSERRAYFKKSMFDRDSGLLYVKDKTIGGLYLDVAIDTYKQKDNIYAITAILNKRPDNFFVRAIKKREAELFVLLQETDEEINVYALIQSSSAPVKLKIFQNYVEGAVGGRVREIQNWFCRMLCGE